MVGLKRVLKYVSVFLPITRKAGNRHGEVNGLSMPIFFTPSIISGIVCKLVRTMLEAIISFLPSEGAGAIGALDWTAEERKKLAVEVCQDTKTHHIHTTSFIDPLLSTSPSPTTTAAPCVVPYLPCSLHLRPNRTATQQKKTDPMKPS